MLRTPDKIMIGLKTTLKRHVLTRETGTTYPSGAHWFTTSF
jgi:hypothetical protein